MKSMNLRRIDFCLNIPLNDPALVKLYIKLLKNYHSYKGFQMLQLQDKDGIDYPHENNTILRCGSVTLYVYDKYSEMNSKEIYPEEDIDQSHGVLRVELRLSNAKIYHEKQRLEIESTIDFLNASKAIAQDKFEKYLKNLFCEGGYYSYEKAIEIIDESECTPKTKDRLKTLIGYVSNRHGMVPAIDAMMLNDGYNPRKIDNMIEKLNELGVNPVTIPRRDKAEYLPNLLEFLQHESDIITIEDNLL